MGRLGGEYQRVDADVTASESEARRRFLDYTARTNPEVFRSLLQPCRMESLPEAARTKLDVQNYWIRFFILHAKDPEWFASDVEELGCESNIRNTPFLAYFDYVNKRKDQFESIRAQIKSCDKMIPSTSMFYDKIVAITTMEAFIPNWKELKSRKDATWLCEEISEWARQWHLNEDWCLDFALACLGVIKIEYIDKINPSEGFLASNDLCWEYRQLWWNGKAWASARIDKISLEKIRTDYEHNRNLPAETFSKLTFEYSWPRSLRRDDEEAIRLHETFLPFGSKTLSEFSLFVEEQFWRQYFDYFYEKWSVCVGKTAETASEIRRFNKMLKNFAVNARKIIEEDENVEKTVSIKNDNHFYWLIDYQVNKLPYSDLAKNYNIDDKSIREGIDRIGKLVGLKIRPSRPVGRPKGAMTNQVGSAGRTTQKLIRG